MSVREKYPKAQLPRSHYFISVARGESMRTLALRPVAIWGLMALLPLALVWAAAASAYIAFHDDMLAAFLSHEAQMQTSYEERISEARSELDRVASRQLLDQTSFEGRMHDLLSRQARIEQHDRVVEALATEVGPTKEAPVAAAAAVNPNGSGFHVLEQNAKSGASDSVFTPVGRSSASDAGSIEPVAAPKPHPADEAKGESLSFVTRSPSDKRADELIAAAKNPDLDASARLGLIAFSLDRVERDQLQTLAGIETKAKSQATRIDAIVERAGLSADQLSPPGPKGGMGGPFIPLDVADATAPAFDKAVSRAAREVALADKLRRLIVYVPVREPLIGEVTVSSPFGYRPDPFLGRPALHPGIDLVQSYGSEIRATAAGRVVHAGWMGGYGNMVEIDHGNGIATRYGHMSEVQVAEGDEVKPGAVLGRIGSTGRSTGPHLHYEVRLDGEPVDPVRFLGAGAPSAADGG